MYAHIKSYWFYTSAKNLNIIIMYSCADLMCGEALDVTSSELKKFAEKNNVMNWVSNCAC